MGNCLAVSADSFIPPWQRWDDHPARKDWEVLQDLGAGSFSAVFLARHRTNGKMAALKVVFLENPELDDETSAMLCQEGDILAALHHPNLVGCSEVIRTKQAHVLVLEFLKGCNVLDGLHRLSMSYSERDAAGVFRQLAAAVAFLHANSVIHRDIKPENLVYADELPVPGKGTAGHSDKPPPVVKLVDLGMAWRMPAPPEANEERGVLGSAGFVAPEIIGGGVHTPAMDVYSMGVLLFIMLVGRKPFQIEDCEKLRYARMSLAEAPGLKDPRWLDLSPDAKHLLMGMLSFDPKRRLSAAQVLTHEWVASQGGLTLRTLGADVALGAATVAEMRRLRFLCNGVVALRRVAEAAEGGKEKKRKEKEKEKKWKAGAAKLDAASLEHSTYLYELRCMQKREASVRNGRILRGLSMKVLAATYKNAHDTGGSVHNPVGYRMDGNVSTSGATGMRRSGTALLLSSLLSPDSGGDSVYNGGGGGGGIGKGNSLRRSATEAQLNSASQPSGLRILGASIKQYVDVSVHGAGSVRGGKAAGSMVRLPSDGGSSVTKLDYPEEEAVRVVKVKNLPSPPSSRRQSTDSNGGRRKVFAIPPLS